MNTLNTEEDEDSYYPDMVVDSDDEDEVSNEEEEGDYSPKARTVLFRIWTQIFLVVTSQIVFACLSLNTLVPISFTVEEEIDSDGFDKDVFDISGPIIRVGLSPAPCLVHPKFRSYSYHPGSRVGRPKNQRHNALQQLKVTCRTKEDYDSSTTSAWRTTSDSAIRFLPV
jgi:hypothetical protein